jgi:hypothetical protein
MSKLVRINMDTCVGYDCTLKEFKDALAVITFSEHTPCCIVPDDDIEAAQDIRIPAEVIRSLGPADVVVSLGSEVMFMRKALWSRISPHLRPLVPSQ